MAKKKEPDKLALEMIQCVKDGYGCHYGAWKAMQDRPVVIEKKSVIPENWKVCPHCGKSFKPREKTRQIYCELYCQQQAQAIKRSEKNRERQQRYRDRKKAEREANES